MNKLKVTFVAFVVVLLAAALTNISASHKPPKCTNCAPTITLPDGRVCTLVACGSDCAYQCPL